MKAAAIAACLSVKNADSKRFFLQVIERLRNFEWRCVRILSENRGIDFLPQRVDRLTSSNLARGIKRGLDSITGHLVGNSEQVISDREQLALPFGLPRHCGKFFLHVHNLANIGLSKFKCSNEILF